VIRAGIGGLRHVATELGKVDQACAEIRSLSNEEINELLSFIAQLKARRPEVSAGKPRTGSVEALRRHLSKWSFDEGERQALLERVRKVREGEAI